MRADGPTWRADLDVEAAVDDLEGPLFYRAVVHGRPSRDAAIVAAVDRVLERPPRRSTARARVRPAPR